MNPGLGWLQILQELSLTKLRAGAQSLLSDFCIRLILSHNIVSSRVILGCLFQKQTLDNKK